MKENVRKFLSLFLVGILILASIPAYAANEQLRMSVKGTMGIDGSIGESYGHRDGEYKKIEGRAVLVPGEEITVKAIEGSHTAFDHWTAYYNKGKEGELDDILENPKLKETKLRVPENIKTHIILHPYFVAKLPINVSKNQPNNEDLKITANVEGETNEGGVLRAKNGENVNLTAISEDDNWIFSHWEFKKAGIIGEGTINHNVDLESSTINFQMVTPKDINDVGDESALKLLDLNIIAHFKRKNEEVKIISISDITREVERYTTIELPNKVLAMMNDETSQDISVVWFPNSIDTSKIGQQFFEGTVEGYDKKVKLTVNVIEPTIASISPIIRTVKQGDSVVLPNTIDAKMSNNRTEKVVVTWKDNKVDTSKVGKFIFEGKVEGYTPEVIYTLIIEEHKYEITLLGQGRGDRTAKACIVNEDGKLSDMGDFKSGEKLKLRAVDGEYARFSGGWKGSVGYDYEVLNEYFSDISSRETIFTVPEMGKLESDKIKINAYFSIALPIRVRVSPEGITGISATINLDEAINEEQVGLNAITNNKDWEFSHWEFSRPIVGAHTPNEDVNLSLPNITFRQVCRADLIEGFQPDIDELNITAYFKEKVDLKIVAIENIEKEIEIGEEYNLPIKVSAKMSDNSIKDVNITWNPKIVDTSKKGIYEFKGTVLGHGGEVKLTLTVKEKEPIQEILEIKTVELLKDGQLISGGHINGEQIIITLPDNMSQEEIDVIGRGGYILKITTTEGVTIKQEDGYEGPFWQEGKAVNMIDTNTPTKFILHGQHGTKEYTLTIVAKAQENKTHTITFDTNGGSNISSRTVKDGNIAIKPSNPTKDGYKFLNWYTDLSLINIFNFNTTITEDITLYAKWEKVSVPVIGKYTVDFNTNGGNSISSQLIDEGRKANEPSNPTRPGYSFVNWYTDSSLINIFNFNTAITEDITLYAKWDKAAEESNSARITKFSLLGYEGSIDDRNGYITVYIPYNMELNGLVPNITLSEGATISPRGDVAVSFNRSVYYTVYAKDGSKKEYRVSIDMPRENSSRENYWDDYYDNYKRKRDDYYKKRSEISWWEMSQEAKKEREKEALKDNRDELLILKERSKIMNEVGKIESRFKNKRGSLYIREGYNTIEIKPTVSNFAEGHSNMIIIPKGLLSSLSKGEYNYITYTTGVVNIDIYPFMETITGLRLNLKDVSKDIRKKWDKVKGKGFIFEVESDSTKGGLSYELNLEKKYPIEKIRFVQYDYTKGNFKDASPEKWYIFDGKIRCEKVSAGIYGIIYKD